MRLSAPAIYLKIMLLESEVFGDLGELSAIGRERGGKGQSFIIFRSVHERASERARDAPKAKSLPAHSASAIGTASLLDGSSFTIYLSRSFIHSFIHSFIRSFVGLIH